MSVVTARKEADPSGKASNEPGAKLDAGKAPVHQGVMVYFPRAILEVARVSAHGARKYTWNGWRSVEGGIIRYSDAMERHIVKEQIEGPIDKDSGPDELLHAAQVAWNALARLELMLEEREEENANNQ
jgi:hypothetical protein